MVKTRYMQNEPGASYMPENKGMFQPITKKKKKRRRRKRISMELDSHIKDIETNLKDFSMVKTEII